jgi:hypothetical protein
LKARSGLRAVIDAVKQYTPYVFARGHSMHTSPGPAAR